MDLDDGGNIVYGVAAMLIVRVPGHPSLRYGAAQILYVSLRLQGDLCQLSARDMLTDEITGYWTLKASIRG